MAYTPNYSSTDISEIVVDLLAGLGVALVGFAGIIGLVLLYRWFRGKKTF